MLTILTATYNRAHTLSRLYASLLAQTQCDFEWLIIDDGSNDNSKELINEFLMEGKIKISSQYQENMGKHAAINRGVSICRQDWIFIVDSDDVLTPDAVEEIKKVIGNPNCKDAVGFCFRRSYFDGALIGVPAQSEELEVLTPTAAGHKFKGDLAYIFSRAAMTSCLFPIIPGEKFVPELYIWNKISDQGRIYYNGGRSIYLAEYLPEGYSKSFKKVFIKNPMGFFIFYASQISRERKLLPKIKNLIRSLQCLFRIIVGVS